MHTVRSGSPFEKLASYSRAARAGDVVAVSGTAALDAEGSRSSAATPPSRRAPCLRPRSRPPPRSAPRARTSSAPASTCSPATEWRAAVEVHGEIFRGVDPANTTLHVAELIPQDCLVEVELDAVASAPVPESAR